MEHIKKGDTLNSAEEKGFLSSTQKKYITINLLHFFFGILISHASIFENYSPFGLALIASVQYDSIWPTAFGCIIGYLLPNQIGFSIRYISAILAIHAIRWTFNDLKKIKNHPFFSPLLAFLVTLVTGFTLNFSLYNYSALKTISIILIESILAGACTFFFKECSSLISSATHKNFHVTEQTLPSFAVVFFISMIALSNVKVFSMSLGRVIAIVTILFFANFFGASGGSMSGIALGIALGLSDKNYFYLAASYALGGMVSGLMSRFGKFTSTFAFIVSSLIIIVQSDSSVGVISNIYEMTLAIIIFIFIPDKVGEKLSRSLFKEDKIVNLSQSLTPQLQMAANALISVKNSITKVSEKLSKNSNSSYDNLCSDVKNSICKNCGLKTLCWEKKQDETIHMINSLTNTLNESSATEYCNNKNYSHVCCRFNEICNYIDKMVREESIRSTSKKRLNEVKGFVSEQFSNAGEILMDVSNDFSKNVTFDLELAKRINHILSEASVSPINVTCKTNEQNKLEIEIETFQEDKERLETMNLHKIISKECLKALDKPIIETTASRCYIKIIELPEFELEIGACQHSCHNSSFCGDNFTYFNDRNGNVVFILSDGMGTGGRAAVEGAMATEILSTLIKSGINFETSLKITNSALLVKSDDESLTAIDILSVNLFTGLCRFIKAGAPVSFVKTNNSVSKIDLHSLPIGIFKSVSYFSQNFQLSEGDTVLLLSDGVIFPDDTWIEKTLLEHSETTAQSLSETIVNKAKENRSSEFDDDITAIVIKLLKR